MWLELFLIFLGLFGVLMKRNLLGIGFCFLIIFLGILLLIAPISMQLTSILAFVFSLQMLVYAIICVFVWRNRGTLHLDEIRELKG